MFFLVVTSNVSAFIIDQHGSIGRDAIAQTSSSPITQEILQYEDYYHMCNIITDISVVGYFTIDAEEEDGFFDKFFKALSFRIGRTYRATHSQNACLRALSEAENTKQRVCGYGLCSHLVQDDISHNQGVPSAIRKTRLYNGVVHSIKEIHDKNLFTNQADRVYSRQILDLAYEEEIQSYLEDVLVEDPAFSDVNVREMIDFFVNQVQPEAEYRLGFRAFFALPTYIYWVILILFFLSIALAGLSIRKIRDGQRDITTFFSAVLGVGMLIFVGTAIYGLLNGTVWSMWESLSQYLFSPATYFIGGFFILVGGFITFQWVVKPNKVANLGNLAVASFVLLIGGYLVTLPTGLTIGNEQALNNIALEHTKLLLTNGVNYINTIGDPVGYNALRDANAYGATSRTVFLLILLFLLASILFFTFRRRRK